MKRSWFDKPRGFAQKENDHKSEFAINFKRFVPVATKMTNET